MTSLPIHSRRSRRHLLTFVIFSRTASKQHIFVLFSCCQANFQIYIRIPRPIVDRSDCIIGAFAGQSRDPAWSNVKRDASQAVHQTGVKASFNKKQAKHRRGLFPALAIRVSFDSGQKVCAACRYQ
jgi:hypothetical protein